MSSVVGSVPLWLALLPPAVYLFMIGLLHLRHRPSAVAGGWDAAAVALAVACAVVMGPLDHALPTSVGGSWRAVLGVICFALVAVMVQLASRPRLVVYNVSIEQLRPVVAQVAAVLDPSARWAGETVALPGRAVQVHLDGRGGMRSVSLVAIGTGTSAEAWSEFSRRTRRAVRRLRVRPSPWAALFLAAGALLAGAAGWMAWQAGDVRGGTGNPTGVADSPFPPVSARSAGHDRPVAPAFRAVALRTHFAPPSPPPSPTRSGALHAGPRRFVGA